MAQSSSVSFVHVAESRCGTCQQFYDHSCPRNDLYLEPNRMVQNDFAAKCNQHKKVQP